MLQINNRQPGTVHRKCAGGTNNAITIGLLMSMNAKQAQKLFSVIQAYKQKLPITLFVYGDFAELFPDQVTSWANHDHVTLGTRGDSQYPRGHLDHMGVNWIREGVVSSQVRLSELQIETKYYYPDNVSASVIEVAKSRGLTIVQPSAAFPPTVDGK